ncbi:hypothetical protein HYPSUDRAFT_200120 [Hypholoma sublateritium FD-334 SS-4]|uniref:Uncharacterized protein n=1 Tax=Hypholoma sublateritium (strain FD-334 SS-4) TaxID=945553 RepID=A0A0D2LC73_HYPSF|nr:hypothetical protein HYPSUDRAFT_200120 [Hypholoma sublateritium FD-334 SS-4]
MPLGKLIRKVNLLPFKWRGHIFDNHEEPLEEEETIDPAWYHRLLASRVHWFSNITSQSNAIPVPILAFRLITRMLAIIPQSSDPPFPAVDNFANSIAQATWTTNERRELRISNAFAHLAVAEHDVVAISTNHAAFHRTTDQNFPTPDTNKSLGIMACSTLQSDNIKKPTDTNTPGVLNRIYDILFARNDEKSEPHEPVPSVVSPQQPADFKPDDGLPAYMKNLETTWQEPTLASHLWILSRLLAHRSDSINEQCKRLYKYALSFCCRKMDRRLQSDRSTSYYEALHQVDNFTFKPSKRAPEEADHVQLEASIQSDFNFLCSLSDVSSRSKSKVLGPDKIPNILQLATDAYSAKSAADSSADKLYSEATCHEFHLLLLDLLKSYREVVGWLANMSKSANSQPIPETDKETFKNKVNDGRLYGYLLLRLARGRAYELYLENLEPLLAERIHAQLAKQDADPHKTDGDADDTDLDKEIDKTNNKDKAAKRKAKATEEEIKQLEEVDLIASFETIYTVEGMLMKSFVAWLRLTVVHIDACEILVEFVNDKVQFPYDDIAIKMLVAPTSGPQILPWRKLFTTPGLFPTEDKSNPFDTIKNDEIKKFLEKGIQKAVQAVEARDHAKKAYDGLRTQRYGRIRVAISKMAMLTPPDPLVISLNNILVTSKGNKSQADSEVDTQIAKGVRGIYDKYPRDDPFGGALHCEIFLATLLDDTHYGDHWPLQQSDIKGYRRVIGVSKLCCPVCFRFLHLLSTQRSAESGQPSIPFLTRGSHPNISACTLPLWTPTNIVDDMNLTFGTILRKDLINIINRPSVASENLV